VGETRTVYRYLETLKQAEVKPPVNLHRLQKFSATTALWLFVRDPNTLDEIEREDLAAFCQASPTLKRAYQLIQDFLVMVRKREGKRLDAWLERVTESGLPELQSFAAGVEKDKEAVRAGLTWWINNGMVARPRDQIETYQTNDVRQSSISPPSPTGVACGVAGTRQVPLDALCKRSALYSSLIME
jgi:transposase